MTEKTKVVFAEGCFDHLDLTQEEMDELALMIQALADSGELLSMAKPLTEEEEEELLAMVNHTNRTRQ